MTKGEGFMKKGKRKKIRCSSMWNSAWCNLKSKGTVMKLHDICSNPKCKCQKDFAPKQMLPLILNNFNWKVLVLKIHRKKYTKVLKNVE